MHDTDVPISLEYREKYIGNLSDTAIEPQILQHIVFAETIAARRCFVERSISHDHIAAALDQQAQSVEAT